MQFIDDGIPQRNFEWTIPFPVVGCGVGEAAGLAPEAASFPAPIRRMDLFGVGIKQYPLRIERMTRSVWRILSADAVAVAKIGRRIEQMNVPDIACFIVFRDKGDLLVFRCFFVHRDNQGDCLCMAGKEGEVDTRGREGVAQRQGSASFCVENHFHLEIIIIIIIVKVQANVCIILVCSSF